MKECPNCYYKEPNDEIELCQEYGCKLKNPIVTLKKYEAKPTRL